MAQLDDVDRRIIEALRADGRLSMRTLAESLHISRANVYARARNGWTAKKAAQSGLHEQIADMLQRAETEGAPQVIYNVN